MHLRSSRKYDKVINYTNFFLKEYSSLCIYAGKNILLLSSYLKYCFKEKSSTGFNPHEIFSFI